MKRHGLTALVLVWMVSALVLCHGTLDACEKCGHADHHDAACAEHHDADHCCANHCCGVFAATDSQREILPENAWLSELTATSYPAMLCINCGFGNKKDNCVKCGRWIANNGVPARLCVNCGFGNKKDNCVKCGKWIGTSGVPAMLCNNCAFGNKKNDCVLCGRWLGN